MVTSTGKKDQMFWKSPSLFVLPLALLLNATARAESPAMSRLDIDVLCQAMPYRCPQGAQAATAANFDDGPPPQTSALPANLPLPQRRVPGQPKPLKAPVSVQAMPPTRQPGERSAAPVHPITPVMAMIMEECAKSVTAGAQTLTTQHLTDIDRCVAFVRGTLLLRSSTGSLQ
jgi:hypothetical protein